MSRHATSHAREWNGGSSAGPSTRSVIPHGARARVRTAWLASVRRRGHHLLWRGPLRLGRPVLEIDGLEIDAVRVSFELAYGPARHVRSTCGMGHCVSATCLEARVE